MPFTLSHPAIVLPFSLSKRFSTTALIVGSMVPDFEYFFQMREVENIGHHWYGIILFDMPMATVLCFVFHNFVRPGFVANAPLFLQQRFASFAPLDWNTYLANNKLVFVYSLFLGVVSHLAWDAFTHHDGFFVGVFPVLASKTNWGLLNVPIFFFLQLFCSVLGLIIVMYAVFRLPKSMAITHLKAFKYYWPIFIGFFLFLFVARITLWPQFNTLGGLAIAAMGSVTYSFIFISFISNYALYKRFLR